MHFAMPQLIPERMVVRFYLNMAHDIGGDVFGTIFFDTPCTCG
jgi:hypothetical protein